MIIATIPYASTHIPVEVVDARDGKATVRTMDGSELFPRYTHGGWCYDSSKEVPVPALSNVSVLISEEKEKVYDSARCFIQS